MSRLTQARRWAAQSKRKQLAKMTEHVITPDEAREALTAIVLQTGHVLERLYEYNPRTDRFHAVARSADGKLIDVTVPGETVAKTVAVARSLAGQKQLIRPSERRAVGG